MTSPKPIFFSSLIVAVLLLVAALISGYDAHTIIEAEEDEEEIGKVLISADRWFTDIQEAQIAMFQFLISPGEENLVSIQSKRYDAARNFQVLQTVLATHLPEGLPRLHTLEDLQRDFLTGLDRAIELRRNGWSALDAYMNVSEPNDRYLDEIQVFLAGLTERVGQRRDAINARVSRSILRGSVSFALMTVIMIAFLVGGHRATTRRLATIQELSDRLEHAAMHDHLTGLPNRRYFNDWLSRSLSLATRADYKVALLSIDLDEFKQVNDGFGHHAGDEVLVTVAERLQKILRESDFALRLGGDEFAVLIPNVQGRDQLAAVARRIIVSAAEEIPVTGGMVSVGSSIGIAIYPDDAGDANELVKAADSAMYHAKDRGKNQYCFFEIAPASGMGTAGG